MRYPGRYLTMDATDLEFEDASFDAVFNVGLCHHLSRDQVKLGFSEWRRVLRPGGTLVIVDFERVKGVSEEWVLGHVCCGKGTVTDEVKDAGFDFIEEVPMMEGQYVRKFKKRD